MDFDDRISSIIRDYDLTSDVGRKKAFTACVRHADETLDDSIDYNWFMSLVAKRLQLDPVVKNVLRLVPSDGSEKVILRYSESGGPGLSGNRAGLIYLSRAFAVLATSKLTGDHFHLRYHEFPMVGRSFPLTVSLSDEAWFEDEIRNEASAQDEPKRVRKRDIDPDQVLALVITDQIPEELLLTPGRVYRVCRHEKLRDQKAWAKSIRDDKERMHLFEFTNDDGAVTTLGLDLDDQGVVFLTRKDLQQAMP